MVLITSSCSLTVPVVSCCWALSQPVQTPVQSMLDPVLCARGVLHLHRSGSAEGREIRLMLNIKICYSVLQNSILIHAFCEILFSNSFVTHMLLSVHGQYVLSGLFCMREDHLLSIKICLEIEIRKP